MEKEVTKKKDKQMCFCKSLFREIIVCSCADDGTEISARKFMFFFFFFDDFAGNALRSTQTQSVLSILADSKGIHMIASFDHLRTFLCMDTSCSLVNAVIFHPLQLIYLGFIITLKFLEDLNCSCARGWRVF